MKNVSALVDAVKPSSSIFGLMCKKSQSQETQKEQHCPDQGDKLGEACVLKVRLKNKCW